MDIGVGSKGGAADASQHTHTLSFSQSSLPQQPQQTYARRATSQPPVAYDDKQNTARFRHPKGQDQFIAKKIGSTSEIIIGNIEHPSLARSEP